MIGVLRDTEVSFLLSLFKHQKPTFNINTDGENGISEKHRTKPHERHYCIVNVACDSIRFYIPLGMTGGTLCFRVVCPSSRHTLRYHFCVQRPTIIALPTWCRCAPPMLFWPWPPFSLFPRSCVALIFFVNLHWSVGTTLSCMHDNIHMM